MELLSLFLEKNRIIILFFFFDKNIHFIRGEL